jgi:signal peptidase I
MTNTLMHQLVQRLHAEDGVIGRVALLVVILALIIVFALTAFIIPGESCLPGWLQRGSDETDDLLLAPPE